jgi:hypothetical protein
MGEDTVGVMCERIDAREEMEDCIGWLGVDTSFSRSVNRVCVENGEGMKMVTASRTLTLMGNLTA